MIDLKLFKFSFALITPYYYQAAYGNYVVSSINYLVVVSLPEYFPVPESMFHAVLLKFLK